MSKKRGPFAFLSDGKGFEWYHLVIIALVAGALAFSYGKSSVQIPDVYCDTHQVIMDNRAFEPQVLEIHPCDTVIWENRDSGEMHTVTFKTSVEVQGCPEGMVCSMEGISSEHLVYKDTFSRKFDEKGTFEYYSEPYKEVMTGRIIVN